jgi:hypothetical protein
VRLASAKQPLKREGWFSGMLELIVGILAALAFPVIAVSVYHRGEARRNRKAAVRRTQKIKLAPRDKAPRDRVD